MKLTAHPLAEALPPETTTAAPTDKTLALRLRISFALMLTKGEQLAETFYALLFERSPGLRPLFPAEMAQQRAKLTQTLAWIVTHLDRRDELLPGVHELGRRHASYGAAREHYPFVRDTLIDAMARTAGTHWDERIAEDWRLSIDLIARHMLAAATTVTSTAPR